MLDQVAVLQLAAQVLGLGHTRLQHVRVAIFDLYTRFYGVKTMKIQKYE